jgi:predicted phage-related endonuclease
MSTVELETKCTDLQELKRMKEELEAEITAIEDALKGHMTEAGIDCFTAGAFKVTWQNVESTRLDTTAMKKAMPPEVLNPFMRTTVTRRFTVR